MRGKNMCRTEMGEGEWDAEQEEEDQFGLARVSF